MQFLKGISSIGFVPFLLTHIDAYAKISLLFGTLKRCIILDAPRVPNIPYRAKIESQNSQVRKENLRELNHDPHPGGNGRSHRTYIDPDLHHLRTQKDHSGRREVADRSLPLYVVIGTQFASAMGGGILVAHVGNAYTRGIGHFIYGVLASLPFIIIMVLAKWLRRNNFTTIPDVLAHFTNGNKLIRIVAGVMTVFVPFGWVTSQITAFGNIYSNLTGIDYTLLCVLFAVFALAFVMPSGLKTVAWTDFIFSCFMIAMCIVCVVFVTVMGGGVSNIVSNLNTIDPSMLSFSSSITDNIGVATCMLWIFAVLPGGMTNQIYFQRVCAIKEEKQVNKSLILSAALSLLSFVWAVYMGLSLRSLNIAEIANGPTAWFMGKLPTGVMALFAALVFATLMSTTSSGVQTSVTNITRDIISTINPNIPDHKMVTISRVLSAVLMTIALLMCLVWTDTLNWLTNTYAYSAAALACPVFLSYGLRNKYFITTPGIVAGMVFGLVGCAVAQIMKTSLNFAFIGILVSAVAMVIVSAATKKKGTIVTDAE